METFIIAGIINAGIGALLGNIKKRALAGAILGFFLGIIGWILILVLEDRRRKCPYCRATVADDAKTCPRCRKDI